MVNVKKKRNFRKRQNYVIATCVLVLFYTWLGHYAYSPGDATNRPGAVAGNTGAGDGISPRSHGLVADFRKDIPIYTPSQVRRCHVADPDTRVSAILHTSNVFELVSGFYRMALVQNGWDVQEHRLGGSGEQAGAIVLFRSEKRRCLLNIQLTGNGEGTDIRIRLTPNPAATE